MKRQYPQPVTLALFVCLLPIAVFALPLTEGLNLFGLQSQPSGTAKLLTETDQYIEVEWEWSAFKATTVATTAGEFQKLSLDVPLPASRQALGEPELPIDVELIRFPSGSFGTVEVIDSEWLTFENVRPYPVQFPSRDGAESPPFAFNPDSYNSSTSIPAEIAGVTTPKGWGGLDVGSLWASPFRYTPATKQLEVAKSIRVRVWFQRDNSFHAITTNSPSPWLQKAQRAALLNPPVAPPVIDDFDEPEPIRLLVVTREAALETAQPLIDLHKNSGLKTEIWVVDGNIEPVDIKDRIREMYADGLQYILFIGDGDVGSPDIPMYYWNDDYPGVDLGDPDACGSDSWYTCLDGEDRDGYTDHLPDIALGRLVYDNVNALAQLQVQIDKISDYIAWQFDEQNSDWLRRGVLMAHKQLDPNHDYITCKRTITERDYAFEHPVWDTLYGKYGESTNERMLELIANGTGMFNYRGHGDYRMWWHWDSLNQDVTSATVAAMQNRQAPFILISSACETGDIYANGRTCLMESFQKNSHGGSLSANGCTMTTFTLGNSYCDVAIFDAFYDDGIFNIGYANNAATVASVLYFDANAPNNWRGIGYVNMRAYLWLGDATIDYRLADPAILSIEAPDLIPEGSRQLEVVVSAAQEPFENATVTARTFDDAIFAVATTDVDGRALLQFDRPLEMQETLTVTASNREAKPTSQPVLVANGMGVIEGYVIRRADGTAIAGATIDLLRFHVVTLTDVNGAYRIEGIPSGVYELIASVQGMIPQTQNVEVTENMVTPVDFEMMQSRMQIATDSVSTGMEADSEAREQVAFSNTGDATLEWTVEFQPDTRRPTYTQILEFLPGWENEDSKIFGAVFTGDKFYVAGGNNAADPNYIYVFDREGNEIPDERFEQASSGNGFRDLDWDGEFLYGAATDQIKVMDLNGQVVETIEGPYNPSRAIAVDPNGSIWVGNNRSNVVLIDRQGAVLQSIPVNFFVLGLAWYQDQEDGNNLLMWGRAGVSGVELYAANPMTGRTTFLQDLTQFAGESAIEGLSVTSEYDSRDWMMVGMAGSVDSQTLRLLQLDPRRDWISLDPRFGRLEPGNDSEVALLLNSRDYLPGTTLTGKAQFTTNNLDEVISLPIEVAIAPNSVESEAVSGLPSTFALARVYPNPFNAMLKVEVSLPEAGFLEVGIYDLQGRRVSQAVSLNLPVGNHTISLNGEGLANGLYIIRAASNGRTAIAKAALLK